MKSCSGIIIILFMLGALLTSCNEPPAESNQPKAAIIDQLYLLEPDPSFIDEATAILESGGFTVDLWQGKDITVDFYRNLPRLGYKLIVLRVHSGMLIDLKDSGAQALKQTYLFTGETYAATRYVTEQLTDRVSNALMTDKYPLVFAVNSEFIRKNTRGNFDNTAVISMGCESYLQDDMAVAFVGKGASVYTGWSTVVSLEYVDNATIQLLGVLCRDNMTVTQGIAETMAKVGHDPYFDAYLKQYPAAGGNQTIQELIK
jgi:hypothetical protein